MAQSVLIRKWSYVARLPLWVPPPVKVRQSLLNRLVRSGLEGLRFGKVTLGGVCGGGFVKGGVFVKVVSGRPRPTAPPNLFWFVANAGAAFLH